MSRNPLKGIALKTSLKTTLAVPFGGLLLGFLLLSSAFGLVAYGYGSSASCLATAKTPRQLPISHDIHSGPNGLKILIHRAHGRNNLGQEFTHSGAMEGGMDKTHGLLAAGMPWLYGLKGDRGEFGDDSPGTMCKILPELVRPIRQRAIGPRGC